VGVGVQVAVGVLVIAVGSILIGVTAPRWPARWLRRDVGPLAQAPWETPAFYRRLRVHRWLRHLPEAGAAFGGESKESLPGLSPDDLERYLREVRRGEWVHWLSIAVSVLLFAVVWWPIALVLCALTALGNVPFIMVLRFNRFRVQRILSRESGR
jgi:glycosyl-4,4'-diaponeurosporenoate acyltransferase